MTTLLYRSTAKKADEDEEEEEKKKKKLKKKEKPEPTYFAQGFAPLCSNYTRFVD